MAGDNANNSEKPKDKVKERPPLVPPDERFWQRYSPNHEFPLSSATSGLIHLLVLGVLALGAHTFARWDEPIDVDSLFEGGGGGQPFGEEGASGGRFAKREDVADIKDTTSPQKTQTRGTDLNEVPKPKSIAPDVDSTRRFINEDVAMGKKLSALGENVRDRLNSMQQSVASKGRGGSGSGGGLGTGRGTGTGAGEGPGTGKISKRQERQKRWTMIFNIRDPEDYARQLHALGAMVAVPGAEGQYLVIEDLSQRPAVAKARDIKEINRMFWIDDKPEAVEPLFRVLEYTPVPKYFVAFFPQELERELLKKELGYKNISEERIEETRFQIRRTATGYEPTVMQQDLK